MRLFAIPELHYEPKLRSECSRPWALLLVDESGRAIQMRVAGQPPHAHDDEREVLEAVHEELRRLAHSGEREELDQLYQQQLKNLSLTIRLSEPESFAADTEDDAVQELDRRAAAAWG